MLLTISVTKVWPSLIRQQKVATKKLNITPKITVNKAEECLTLLHTIITLQYLRRDILQNTWRYIKR